MELDVFGQAKKNAEGVDVIARGFERARLVAAEGGFRKGGNEVEGLGVNAVAEGETVGARHASGLRDQP